MGIFGINPRIEMGNYDNRIQQKEILGDKTHKHPSAQTTLKNGFSEARCE